MFHRFDHIWNEAVARNIAALKTVVASLLGLLTVHGGIEAVTVPRGVYAMILQVLRPAEAALRRLIVIAARDVTVDLPVSKAKLGRINVRRVTHPSSHMSFPLFDPRKRFGQRHVTYASSVPRVFFIAPAPPFSPLFAQQPEPVADTEFFKIVGVRRLCIRLRVIAAALEDVPHQAKRLVRLQARREGRSSMIRPLRPGHPPGYRARPSRGIDFILEECHKFALGVLAETQRPRSTTPNTS
jgi:hypothetical protein